MKAQWRTTRTGGEIASGLNDRGGWAQIDIDNHTAAIYAVVKMESDTQLNKKLEERVSTIVGVINTFTPFLERQQLDEWSVEDEELLTTMQELLTTMLNRKARHNKLKRDALVAVIDEFYTRGMHENALANHLLKSSSKIIEILGDTRNPK